MMRRLSRKQATPAEISQCVSVDPEMALMYADQLSDDQVAACAARVPASAILRLGSPLIGNTAEMYHPSTSNGIANRAARSQCRAICFLQNACATRS